MTEQKIRRSIAYYTESGAKYVHTYSIEFKTHHISESQWLRYKGDILDKKLEMAANVSKEKLLEIRSGYEEEISMMKLSKDETRDYIKKVLMKEQENDYKETGGAIIFLKQKETGLKASSKVTRVEEIKKKSSLSSIVNNEENAVGSKTKKKVSDKLI